MAHALLLKKVMSASCPKCNLRPESGSDIVKTGHYRRTSDSKLIQRYRCRICRSYFSAATSDICYRQRKRHLNHFISDLLASGNSQRRSARLVGVNRKTIVRKFIFMGRIAKVLLAETNLRFPKCTEIEFDDMETFEHTKCKPLSITLAVETKTRRILSYQVSQMPSKGRLSKISIKKYGYRKDERSFGRRILFESLKPLIQEKCVIKSDSNPHYVLDVAKHFPGLHHDRFLGKRGAVTGQGELKKIKFDPLFSLNHTCASLRENVNRLKRRTWSTTKKPERLDLHLAIQAVYHNQWLQ